MLNKIKMVKEVILKQENFYQCEDCKLIYKDKKWAKKCEKWCIKNHTCNLAITKNKSGLI